MEDGNEELKLDSDLIDKYRESIEGIKVGDLERISEKSDEILEKLRNDEEGNETDAIGLVAKYNSGTSSIIKSFYDGLNGKLREFYNNSKLHKILRADFLDSEILDAIPKIEHDTYFDTGYGKLKELELDLNRDEKYVPSVEFGRENLLDLNRYSLLASEFLQGDIDEAMEYMEDLSERIGTTENVRLGFNLLYIESALNAIKAENELFNGNMNFRSYLERANESCSMIGENTNRKDLKEGIHHPELHEGTSKSRQEEIEKIDKEVEDKLSGKIVLNFPLITGQGKVVYHGDESNL